MDHPDYRYPSSRNPYWKKLHDLAGRVYFDGATEDARGGWRTRFPDSCEFEKKTQTEERRLHVEIGCNAGHVIVEWARLHPKDAWIGLDWKFKVIHRAAEKGIKQGLNNLLLARAKAERLKYIFGPGEIDRLYLFFPDPWPRKSQWKHRFVTAERLREIAPLIRPGTGEFLIRTDHTEYFEWMEDAVAQVSELFKVVERTTNRHATHPNPQELEIPEVTLFEKIWIREGIKINAMRLIRTHSL